ncbi:MAG: Fe-S-containing protein [Nitrospirota bacterium]
MARTLKACAFAALVLALSSCARKPEYPAAPSSGDEIRFSISTLREETPVFYSLEHEGTRIDYLLVKVNGRVESYFDACAKCYPKKLGYRVEDKHLVCVACGERYSMHNLKGAGSCYPLPLEGKTEGDTYVIEKADIINGQRYF